MDPDNRAVEAMDRGLHRDNRIGADLIGDFRSLCSTKAEFAVRPRKQPPEPIAGELENRV